MVERYEVSEKGILESIDWIYRWNDGEELEDSQILVLMMIWQPIVSKGLHLQFEGDMPEIAERFVREAGGLRD